MIRGNVSLGSIIQSKFANVSCVPSPTSLSPASGNYYSGGYIVQSHGSLNCNTTNVSAIQMELPSSMRATDTYATYADTLATAIYDFYNLHFA